MLDNAKWVGCFDEEAPLIRGKFELKDAAEEVQIEIFGLGTFKLFINGHSVTDEVFPQLWSDFHKREISNLAYEIDINPTYRIYVSDYSITRYVNKGENICSVILGNGWYNQTERTAEGNMAYAKPVLCYRIIVRYKNGGCEQFVSDEDLKWRNSHITYNNLYMGEIHDLRLYSNEWMYPGFDDSDWCYVESKVISKTVYEKKKCPGDKRIRTIEPKLIARKGNKKIYDCGENITGWVKIRAGNISGKEIKIEYAEEIYSDKSLNFESTGGENQIQKNIYICSDEAHICEPYFTWHAFRYFSIEGPAEIIECVIVHSPIEIRSEFECDNPVLNWIYDSYVRTQSGNMHLGVPSDCPHRERLGYTGDGQLTSGAAMCIFESKEFYRKWIRDVLDCQNVSTGRIEHSAPFYGGGGGNGGWGCAVVVVPYNYYKYYFGKDILQESYPYMEKWAEYMFTQTEDGLAIYEERGAKVLPDYWNLGDWCTPDKVEIPQGFVNTYYLIKALLYMKEIAGIINKKFNYAQRIDELKAAMVREYFDSNTHAFCKSVQGADAFALDIGLGDEKTEQGLLAKYSAMNEFDTGIFGTYVLIKVLLERGYCDEAIDLLTSDGRNSFSTMMNTGATTLWETWDGTCSHNHPMFGAVAELFFSHLLGIEFEDEEHIKVKPQTNKRLKNIRAKIKTDTGCFTVNYRMSDDKPIIETDKK